MVVAILIITIMFLNISSLKKYFISLTHLSTYKIYNELFIERIGKRLDLPINYLISDRSVIIIANTECSSCYQSMMNWNNIIIQNNKLKNKVIFFMYGSKNDYWNKHSKESFMNINFKEIDEQLVLKNKYEDILRIPIIIDKKFNILFIGDPFENTSVKKLFFKILNNE